MNFSMAPRDAKYPLLEELLLTLLQDRTIQIKML